MKGGDQLNQKTEQTPENEEEYVWRFKLAPPGEATPEEDPMIEMVRMFLADFLSIGFLTRGGERVKADGFSFEKDPDVIHEIFTRSDGNSAGRK
jgi:hypothetical protein